MDLNLILIAGCMPCTYFSERWLLVHLMSSILSRASSRVEAIKSVAEITFHAHSLFQARSRRAAGVCASPCSGGAGGDEIGLALKCVFVRFELSSYRI